jgi:hypothetical protein
MAGVGKMATMLWLLAAVFMLGAAVGLAEGSKHGHNYYDFFVSLLHVLACILVDHVYIYIRFATYIR